MGAGLYRRIGFQDLGSTLVELESGTSTGAGRSASAEAIAPRIVWRASPAGRSARSFRRYLR
jgi:hypothetical protein